MKIKKNLVLLGMMGSGKSTIGYLVAQKLKKRFVDVDRVIEKEMKNSIAEIFEKKGEKFFRGIEEKIVLKTLKNNDTVISLGGGSFVNEKIRKEVLNKNISFWLNWSSLVLLKRIKKNNNRPVVFNMLDNEILNLINLRSKFYIRSNYKIDCDGMTKKQIVKKIKNIYENI
jgi:shikimate kinase|tara:strand:+ start:4719 stop:5231 length:513 start_codon:yes stop_codon:yes gene_type:complete